jgi:hypothetical protein
LHFGNFLFRIHLLISHWHSEEEDLALRLSTADVRRI